MIPPAVVLAVAGGMAGLPRGEAHYRFEIGGEAAGAARFAVSCRQDDRCAAVWETRLRLPDDAGGGLASSRVEVEVGPDGRSRGGPLRVRRDGQERLGRGVPGAVPLLLAEALLARGVPGDGSALCLEVFDEETLARGRACGRREEGGGVSAELPGGAERIAPGADGFPEEVHLPGQGVRWVREARAAPPDRPPRLHGTAVPGTGAPAAASRFCGVARDPGPPRTQVLAPLPEPHAEGESCREKTARWLARAAERGFEGRTAVGVAWDGGGWVWHAWAEVRVDGAWVPVDPSFEQLPASGPRFTLARYGPDDAVARAEAGRRILACWGKARVEER